MPIPAPENQTSEVGVGDARPFVAEDCWLRVAPRMLAGRPVTFVGPEVFG
jgi:hypothetical protein